MKKLLVVSCLEPSTDDMRLVAFAAHMGVGAETRALAEPGALAACGQSCLALSGATLAALTRASVGDSDSLLNDFRAILVFGCNDSPAVQSALGQLTRSAISAVTVLTAERLQFAFPPESRPLTRQLAGLGFSEKCPAALAAFEVGQDRADAEVLTTANGCPIFVRIQQGGREIFLFGGPMPQIDAPLSRDRGLEEHYIPLAAPLIFLRHCFGNSVWHGTESTARLIVDDPLLSRRYGFLDLEALLKSMRRLRYGVSIAFIPWNAWRTSKRAAARLHGTNLSICIHGCDHTNREFQDASPSVLDAKAALAMERMLAHRNRTDAPFEDAMVFPQGRFAASALQALRVNNYLAAVNTTCFPPDAGPGELTVKDFLQPAVTRYGGFPIFQRRYPRRLFDLAFDLFLGKPALMVEHHEYFQPGLGALEALVAALSEVEPALAWPDLSTQLSRCCLTRTAPSADVEVRFFTRRFQFANRNGHAGRFALSKAEPEAGIVARVLVDGAPVPFWLEDGLLKLELEAKPGQVRNIEVVDREQQHPRRPSSSTGYRARVLLRRSLSEFRDNTLSRHRSLLKAARSLAKILKTTGEG